MTKMTCSLTWELYSQLGCNDVSADWQVVSSDLFVTDLKWQASGVAPVSDAFVASPQMILLVLIWAGCSAGHHSRSRLIFVKPENRITLARHSAAGHEWRTVSKF